MEDRVTWSGRLRAEADAAGVRNHAFLRAVMAPSPSRRVQLLSWAEQDYFVSASFPRLLALLIAEAEDPEVRHLLVENLWEEHGEGSLPDAHVVLFEKLLGSVQQALPTPDRATRATRDFIYTQESLARRDLLMGLGAFTYANEYMTVQEFATLRDAFASEFGEQADLGYFVANSDADIGHTESAEEAIQLLVRSDTDLRLVAEGAAVALQKRVAFYDALL